jgi:hypothetical protein
MGGEYIHQFCTNIDASKANLYGVRCVPRNNSLEKYDFFLLVQLFSRFHYDYET